MSAHPRARKFAQITLAFTLSGLLHLAGEYHCLHSLRFHFAHHHPPSLLHLTVLRFDGVMTTFALQPLALGIEQTLFLLNRLFFASSTWKSIPPRRRMFVHWIAKGLGYVWVIAWFSFSMSFYTCSMMGAGFMTSRANIPRGWTVGVVRSITCTVKGALMVYNRV